MSDTINIQTILEKYYKKNKVYPTSNELHTNLAAIKEIAEAIVDKCIEDAKSKRGQYQHYVVDKESIENVKKLIKYE